MTILDYHTINCLKLDNHCLLDHHKDPLYPLLLNCSKQTHSTIFYHVWLVFMAEMLHNVWNETPFSIVCWVSNVQMQEYVQTHRYVQTHTLLEMKHFFPPYSFIFMVETLHEAPDEHIFHCILHIYGWNVMKLLPPSPSEFYIWNVHTLLDICPLQELVLCLFLQCEPLVQLVE